ncbi:hypothetical protein CKQ84_14160 [Shewanella sp. WE21]|uniref:hypothetical protein n=1 Tax=Shewanella sp. WE21 TaxID=2029986 RepID=UPI000CF6C871|nr:hypothetical protein [Shewanella sp. WE21]AVI66932.1 hypothetical protein CKQ84_14160 [Shewanella sp. WE21]
MGGNVASRNSTEMNEHKQDSQAHDTNAINHQGQSLSDIITQLLDIPELISQLTAKVFGWQLVYEGALEKTGIAVASPSKAGEVWTYIIVKSSYETAFPRSTFCVGTSTNIALNNFSGVFFRADTRQDSVLTGLNTGGSYYSIASCENGIIWQMSINPSNELQITSLPLHQAGGTFYQSYSNLTQKVGLLPGEDVFLKGNPATHPANKPPTVRIYRY